MWQNKTLADVELLLVKNQSFAVLLSRFLEIIIHNSLLTRMKRRRQHGLKLTLTGVAITATLSFVSL